MGAFDHTSGYQIHDPRDTAMCSALVTANPFSRFNRDVCFPRFYQRRCRPHSWLDFSQPLSVFTDVVAMTGAKVYCKFDHLQITGSFKERGARNKLVL